MNYMHLLSMSDFNKAINGWPDDLIIRDNRCMMHRVSTDFDVNEKREFHRLLLKGEVPV